LRQAAILLGETEHSVISIQPTFTPARSELLGRERTSPILVQKQPFFSTTVRNWDIETSRDFIGWKALALSFGCALKLASQLRLGLSWVTEIVRNLDKS
jgi:hypothetical protein